VRLTHHQDRRDLLDQLVNVAAKTSRGVPH
jgi:hypothetical protein